MKKSILVIAILILTFAFTACKKPDEPEKSLQEETVSTDLETNEDENIEVGNEQPGESQAPEEVKYVTGSQKEISTELVNAYINGEFEKILKEFKYDESIKSQLNEEVIDSVFTHQLQPYGEFIQISKYETEVQVNIDITNVICEFAGGNLVFSVAFNSDDEIVGFNIFPYFAKGEKPANIIETEVSFGDPQRQLPATLTLPADNTKCPVVILVHGSGPVDRNGTSGANTPFQDIAWQLAAQGIGVLRYDKRTYAYPREMVNSNLTVYEETINDVKYAYSFLQTQAGVDPNSIYILGHGFGGYLMPLIAEEVPDAKGYILLAPAAIPLHELVLKEINYIANLDGNISEDESFLLDYYQQAYSNITRLDEESELTSADLMNYPKVYWLTLKDYNPIFKAQSIVKPILILQGSRDFQVTQDNYQLWQQSLSNKESVTFKLYEGLNHNFVEGSGPSTPNEYQTSGNVRSDVTSDIALWIFTH